MNLPKYDNPPLNELVIGITFDPLEGLRSEHIGSFWRSVRENYSEIEQAPPLEGIITEPGEVFPMPRYWFKDASNSSLIQVQKNKFLCNWRKPEQGGEYPSFSKVYGTFVKNWESFLSFLREENINLPSVIGCELSYVNHLHQGVEWNDLEDLSGVLPEIACPVKHRGEKLKGFNIGYSFIPADQIGEIILKIQSAENRISGKRIVNFEINVKSVNDSSNLEDIDAWYKSAHEHIVKTFESFTDENIQKDIWKKRES